MVKLFSVIIGFLSILLIVVSVKYKIDVKGKENVMFLTFSVNVHNNEDDYCVEANLLANDLGNRMREIYNVNECRYLYHDANPENLRNSLENLRKYNFLVLYIGSHGGSEGGFFQAYLTNGEAKPRGEEYTHIAIKGKEIIDRIGALRIPTLIIIDTCHSGSIIRDLTGLPENISVIAACSERESSYSWAITPTIINALKGGADYNNNGSITIRELQRYCYVNVINFPTGNPTRQEVIHFGESDRILSLVH